VTKFECFRWARGSIRTTAARCRRVVQRLEIWGGNEKDLGQYAFCDTSPCTHINTAPKHTVAEHVRLRFGWQLRLLACADGLSHDWLAYVSCGITIGQFELVLQESTQSSGISIVKLNGWCAGSLAGAFASLCKRAWGGEGVWALCGFGGGNMARRDQGRQRA
jgi:hypothetical protein